MRPLLAVLFAMFAGASAAQTIFPSRPVKIITDVGTGGTYDIFARVLAEELNRRWGHGMIVEPRPSGNVVIGTRACAESAPDATRSAFSGPRCEPISLQEAAVLA